MACLKWTLVAGVLVLGLSAFTEPLYAQDPCSLASFISDGPAPVLWPDGEVLWRIEPGTRYCIAGIGEPTWVLIHRQEESSALGWMRFSNETHESLWDSLVAKPQRDLRYVLQRLEELAARVVLGRERTRQCFSAFDAVMQEYPTRVADMLTDALTEMLRTGTYTPAPTETSPAIEHARRVCQAP